MAGLLLMLVGLLIWPLMPVVLGLLLGDGLNRRAMRLHASRMARLFWRLSLAAWLVGVPMGLLAAVYAVWWFTLGEPALLGLGLLVWAAPAPLVAALSLLWRTRRWVLRHHPARPWGFMIGALIVLHAPAALGALVAMERHFEANAYPRDC